MPTHRAANAAHVRSDGAAPACDAAVAVMVKPDSPIKTAKDFEGKRVATAGLNAFLHVLFRKWLSENGADYKKVTFTETPDLLTFIALENELSERLGVDIDLVMRRSLKPRLRDRILAEAVTV